jgi:hypothetical protein
LGRCTEKKNDAERVERQVRQSVAALLLEPRIGERFGAIVTGASDMRTWVRLLDHPVEGKLTSNHGLDVGDSASRSCKHDVERGFIDFAKVALCEVSMTRHSSTLRGARCLILKTTGRFPATTRKHCDERGGKLTARSVDFIIQHFLKLPPVFVYYTAVMNPPSDLSFTDSLTSAQRSGFYERHKPLAVGMILAVFFLPFLGLFIGGLLGVVAGVIISILAYYLAPFVVQKLL